MNDAEIMLATVTGGTMDVGMRIRLDGETEAMAKPYKLLLTGKEPPRSGDRVLVVKISGTYVVLGIVGMPGHWYHIDALASGATTAQAVSKINSLINMMVDTRIMHEE